MIFHVGPYVLYQISVRDGSAGIVNLMDNYLFNIPLLHQCKTHGLFMCIIGEITLGKHVVYSRVL